MGGEWGGEGGEGSCAWDMEHSREKRGAHPSPHHPVGSSWSTLLWSNLQIAATFRSYILLLPGDKYGGGGVDHAKNLNGNSPLTFGDTDGVVSQSVQSGSDDFRGSDVSFLKNISVVHNSCRPVFLVCLGLRLGFSLVDMSSSAVETLNRR